jgi:hypothetical protein
VFGEKVEGVVKRCGAGGQMRLAEPLGVKPDGFSAELLEVV